MKIIEVCVVADTFSFFDGVFRALGTKGHKVLIVSASNEGRLDAFAGREGVSFHALDIRRAMDPLRDAIAVLRLAWLLVTENADMVHGHTPKGVLIGMLAGNLAGIPIRVAHLHGFPVETASGWRRIVFYICDWLSLRMATEVIAVGGSVLRTAETLGYLSGTSPATVLGRGSAGGIDCSNRFVPQRSRSMADHQLKECPFVLLFVGRLSRDKGLDCLLEAWRGVRSSRPSKSLRLLIVGDRDSREPVSDAVLQGFSSDPAVELVGRASDPERFYNRADVAILPTLREGLPYVPLEAGAMELPVIASDIPACREVVLNQVTGLLFEKGNAGSLAEAILTYVDEPLLAISHGRNARSHIATHYSKNAIIAAWQAWLDRLQQRAYPNVW